MPITISHQGYLLDGDDVPVHGAHDLTVRLWNDPTATALPAMVWTDTFIGGEIAKGYYSVVLGDTSLAGHEGRTLESSLFAVPIYLSLSIDNNPELLPRHRITTVPTAAIAQDSLLLGGTAAALYLKQADTTLPLKPSGVASPETFLRGDGRWATPTGLGPASLSAGDYSTILTSGTYSVGITGTASNVTGTVALAHGGTGATDAPGARTALGLGMISTLSPTGSGTSSTWLRGDGSWQPAPACTAMATDSTTACTGANAGAIRWTGTAFEGCNGGDWRRLDQVLKPTITSVSPAAGPMAGNTLVTVVGTGFTSDAAGINAVSFGSGTATSVTATSDTTLTCRTPAGTPNATVDVTLMNANGAATKTSAFTYTPPPTVSAVSPLIGPTGGGTTLTITGTGFTAYGATGTVVMVGGVTATGVQVLSDTSVRAVTATGTAGISDVTVTNSNGGATKTGGFKYTSTPTPTGLAVYLDATNSTSYPGSGNTWYNLASGSYNFTAPTAVWNSGGYFAVDSTASNGFTTGSFPMPVNGFTVDQVINLPTYAGPACNYLHGYTTGCSTGNCLHMCFRTAGKVDFDEYGRSLAGATVLANATKIRLTFVHETNNTFSIYLNGALDNSGTPQSAGNYNGNTNTFFLSSYGTGTRFHKVRVYTSALSAAQVADLHHGDPL